MTTTTHSTECSAPGAPLMLAFELGSTKWTLGFTTAPAQRPRIRTMTAGDRLGLVKEILLAKARFGLPCRQPGSYILPDRGGLAPGKRAIFFRIEAVVSR